MNWWSGRSVLITGAHGFIGTALHLALHGLGATVYTYERDGSIRPDKPKDPVDVVFHLAASTVVSDNKADMTRNNFNTTLDILEWARINKSKSFIFVSSDRVYGDELVIKIPYDESDPLLARDIYGTSKVVGDILAQSYRRAGIPRVGIARLSNVYGQGDNHLNRIIPGTMDSLLHGNAPKVNNPYPKRDYVYIDDAVSGLLSLASYSNSGYTSHECDIFNISSGASITNIDLVNRIIEIWGSDIKPEFPNLVIASNSSHQWASPNKAIRDLEWERQFSLTQGLKKTMEWWRSKNV